MGAGFLADGRRTQQILLNLLSNALKFTPKGGTVQLGCVEEEAARVRLSVKDTGPGIAADQIDRIFEEYRQVDSNQPSNGGGIGLGLSLSRRFANSMGGTLECTSVVGEGTTFLLTLPSGGRPDLG